MSLSGLARSRAAEPYRTRSRRSGITSGRLARRCWMSSAVAANVMWSLYRRVVRGCQGTIVLMMLAGAKGEGQGARAPSMTEFGEDSPSSTRGAAGNDVDAVTDLERARARWPASGPRVAELPRAARR